MQHRTKWFRDAAFGGFIHWGLYSIPGGIWGDRETEYIGEWLQARFRIPNEEYAKLAAAFRAEAFDADDWIRRFADAGMRYVVFTAKHHDGFAMFRSRVDSYNIVEQTPFGRDALAEVAAGCRKYGLKLGIYYSQYLDWHEPDGGDPGQGTKNIGNVSWGNDWDFTDFKNKDFGRYFERKVVPQITELLTNYGPVAVIWFDCPIAMEKRYCEALRDLVHRLQPECLINSRIGHGCGDYRSLGDNQMPGSAIPGLVECPATLNDTWGYKNNDRNWKSAEQIVSQLLTLAEKKVNLLLNIGPQPDGAFPAESCRVLQEVARWYQTQGGAVFASDGNPFQQELDFACCLANNNQLHFYPKQGRRQGTVSGLLNQIVQSAVPYRREGEMLALDFSGVSGLLPDVVLTLDGPPQINPALMPQNGVLTLLPAKGVIRHGDSGVASSSSSFDVDGRALGNGTHMKLSPNGTLETWHNPADWIEWEVYFTQGGTFCVSCRTQSAIHSYAWRGEREVEFCAGNTVLRRDLFAAALPEGCYPQAESVIGELTVAGAQYMKLRFRSERLHTPGAATMNLVSIILKREDK